MLPGRADAVQGATRVDWHVSIAVRRLVAVVAAVVTLATHAAEVATPPTEAQLEQAVRQAEGQHGPSGKELLGPLRALGQFYKRGAKYPQAIVIWRRALAIAENTSGEVSLPVADVLNDLAETYWLMSEYELALPPLQRDADIREKIHGSAHPEFALSLANLALLYQEMSDYPPALELSLRSLAIQEKALGAEHNAVASGLGNLGLLYERTGEYALALSFSQRALALNEKLHGPENQRVAIALNNLAALYLTMGEFSRALPLAQRSVAVRERVSGPDHPSVSVGLNALGRTYLAMGEYERAQQALERALAIPEKVFGPESPRVAIALVNLARVHVLKGDNARALPMYRRAIAIDEKHYGPDHLQLARTLVNSGSLDVALGNRSDALRDLQHAARIAAREEHRETLWQACDTLRVLHAQGNNSELAIYWGKLAVNTLQRLRSGLAPDQQGTYLQNKRRAYTDLADLLVREGRIPEAQRVMSMLKDDEYLDFIRRDRSVDARSIEIPLTGVEQGADARVQKSVDVLRRLVREYTSLQRKHKLGEATPADTQRQQALEAERTAANAEYDATVSGLGARFAQAAPATGARGLALEQDVAADLRVAGTGVAAIQYIVSDVRLHLIASTPRGVVTKEVGIGSAALYDRIAAFRRALQDPALDPRPRGQALYDVLIAPLHAILEDQRIHTLMLQLDGALRYVPFAALSSGERYLIERFALAVYTEAAGSRLARAERLPWQVAAMGMTRAVPEQGFNALPAVKEELEGIVNPDLLRGEVLLDEHFTRAALRAALDKPVLHIASHFRFVPGSDASFLLLGDRSQLTLKEVRSEMRFKGVDLLTLSACETAIGGGRNESGLEVEGLGVLAQKQGARAVLATLWPVADASTSVLMPQFYRVRHARADVTKAEALRQAQLALLRGAHGPGSGNEESRAASRPRAAAPGEHGRIAPFVRDERRPYAHPFYWAPFVLMGNWL